MASNVDLKLEVQKLTITKDALKFKCPFGMIVSGPSMAGKSHFLYNLVKYREDIFTHSFDRIIYCQGNTFSAKNQEFFEKIKKECPSIELCQGLPSISALNLDLNTRPALLLIDDLMTSVMWSQAMVELLANDVHNFNISVVVVLQNYFATGKFGKTLIRNCQYRVFFYSRIEQLELRTISSQIANAPNFFAANFQFLYKNYPDAKSHYLVIDGHFRTASADFWCRTNIFPAEKHGEINPIVFYPTNSK